MNFHRGFHYKPSILGVKSSIFGNIHFMELKFFFSHSSFSPPFGARNSGEQISRARIEKLLMQGPGPYGNFLRKEVSVKIYGKSTVVLLMVQKSGDHQLRLVVYSFSHLQNFVHPRWFSRRISEPSRVL